MSYLKYNTVDFIQIDEYASAPKYIQLVNCLLQAIKVGKIRRDDPLPSLNEITTEFDISKATVEKGYRYLKKMGVVESRLGKGFFVCNTEFKHDLKVFLLFNKLSAHKKIIYDSFVEALGKSAEIDFYIYNNDFELFQKYITQRLDLYTHYVIMPHFWKDGELAPDIINMIPKEKLILLDKYLENISGQYGAVYENFEKDIHFCLEQALDRLKKYRTLKFIFPEYTYYPKEMLIGFYNFCKQYEFPYKIVHHISEEQIKVGDVFISLLEEDLVTLVERVTLEKLEVGKQVGIISYNESPLKKIILDGITTISTDFRQMGRSAAQLILENSKEHLEIPVHLTLRASL